jgi:hypothetical protein
MDIFSTGVLRRVVELLPETPAFFLGMFFTDLQEEVTEEIHFDIDESKPRITPFVSPLVAGKVVEQQGFRTGTFKPAYAKDKRIFQPNGPLKREIGEQIGGNLNPMQRRQLALNRQIRDQLRMLTMREEVMAAEVLRTGRVTVKGEGFETKVVNFQRDPALTVTLAGANKWTDGGGDPVGDLEVWAGLTQDKGGRPATNVVLEPTAWRHMRQNEQVQKLLDTRRGSQSEAELGPLAGKVRYIGKIGDFSLWVYQDNYIDADGSAKKLLEVGDVLLIAPGPDGLAGVRAYGAIQDEKADYKAIRYFIKSWPEEDPAVRYLLLQSAPLVFPYRPNASLCAKVL